MDLSIIVPVYNVENYILSCIESLFRQGLDERQFEVIIVNDGTKDRSMEVIFDMISLHQNIVVINQQNMGLSMARNNGLVKAKGRYVLFVDSDDLLVNNSIVPILNKALASNVDLVVADFLLLEDAKSFMTPLLNPQTITFEERNGDNMLLELDPKSCHVWRTMYRKEFLMMNHISFVPDIYFEDVPFSHECYIKAKRWLKTSWPFYIYRKRSESITFSFDIKKAESFIIAIAHTWNLSHDNKLSAEVKYKLEEDVYTSFMKMISYTFQYITNANDRKYIIDYLNTKVPQLYFTHGLKQRIITLLMKNKPHTFIEIYYSYSKSMMKKVIRKFRKLSIK